LQTGVAALEKRSHVRGHESVGKAVVSTFTLDVTQIQSAGRIQVDKAMVGCQRSNAYLPERIFESKKSHKSTEWRAANSRECIGSRQGCLESVRGSAAQ